MSTEEQLLQRFGRFYPAGSVVFREGELGSEMYVVHSGEVRISRTVREVQKVLAILGPGEFFGEMAIISSRPRTATAEALTDLRVLVVDAKTFESMVRNSAEIAVRLLKKFAERLADANQQIESLLLRDPASRVVHYLASQARSRGRETAEGIFVDLDPAALPGILGVPQQAVEEVIARMGRARICLPSGRGVLVPDPTQLDEFLDFLEKRRRFGEEG